LPIFLLQAASEVLSSPVPGIQMSEVTRSRTSVRSTGSVSGIAVHADPVLLEEHVIQKVDHCKLKQCDETREGVFNLPAEIWVSHYGEVAPTMEWNSQACVVSTVVKGVSVSFNKFQTGASPRTMQELNVILEHYTTKIRTQFIQFDGSIPNAREFARRLFLWRVMHHTPMWASGKETPIVVRVTALVTCRDGYSPIGGSRVSGLPGDFYFTTSWTQDVLDLAMGPDPKTRKVLLQMRFEHLPTAMQVVG